VTQTEEATAAPEETVSPALRPLPAWQSVVASVASGVAALLAFPPYDAWWLAPVAVALLAVAVHRRRFAAGLGLGLLSGLVFFVPLLRWTGLHVGMAPWLLLAMLQACYVALLGGAAAWVSPLVDRYRWTWPPLTAALWVGQEALRARTPFGGFPWGRLAFSQGDSPLLRLAALGGAPAVTFAVALAGGLLAVALLAPRELRRVAVCVGGAALVVLAGFAVPLARPAGPTVTVAIVQGSVPRLGLDFNAQRRQVLDNHVDATIALAGRVAAGQAPRPDLVIWPENSSDIDPLRNPDARARIDEATRAIDAPILVGAVLVGPAPDTVQNGGVVWNPGTGPGPTYLKRHPVPFGEYMPYRWFFDRVARLVTAEASLLRADFIGGTEPGVLPMGPTVVGDVICFEVGYDDIVRDTVTHGARLLAVQTNNATFDVPEAEQQLAMVRLRAVEHGRDSLMASTVGVSGFVTADGVVHDATDFDTQEVVVRALTPSTGRTLATRLGAVPEVALATLAFGALVLATVLRRRGRPYR